MVLRRPFEINCPERGESLPSESRLWAWAPELYLPLESRLWALEQEGCLPLGFQLWAWVPDLSVSEHCPELSPFLSNLCLWRLRLSAGVPWLFLRRRPELLLSAVILLCLFLWSWLFLLRVLAERACRLPSESVLRSLRGPARASAVRGVRRPADRRRRVARLSPPHI